MGMDVLGRYEQVPRFGFWRAPVFEVVQDGILYRDQLYPWLDIQDMHARQGIGYIKLSKRVKCTIHMNSFRKVSVKQKLSLFGENAAFDALRVHWLHEKSKAELSRELGPVQAKIEALMRRYDQCADLDECSRLRSELNMAVDEFRRTGDDYLKRKKQLFQRESRKKLIAIAVLLVVMVAAMLLKAFYS